MKKKLATRHLAHGLAMAMSLAMAAGLVYLTVLISSNSFGDDSRDVSVCGGVTPFVAEGGGGIILVASSLPVPSE